MEIKTKKLILKICMVLTCLTLPLSCIPIVFLTHPYNPMAQAFITKFELKNSLPETIYITPIGSGGNTRIIMPQYVSKFPAFMAKKNANLPVEPNKSIQVLYEQDDFCISEIAIVDKYKNYYQLPVDRKTTGCDKIHPIEASFNIKTLSELSQMDPYIKKIITNPPNAFFRITVFFIIGILPIPVLIMLLIMNRRLR